MNLNGSLADTWNRFKSAGCDSARSALVENYMPLLGYQSGRVDRRHTSLERRDLIQEAVPTLMRAMDVYDPKLGVKFETFIYKRIWGAMQQAVYRYRFGPTNQRMAPVGAEMILACDLVPTEGGPWHYSESQERITEME